MILADCPELRSVPWRCVVIDEAHRLKNRNCKLLEGLKMMDMVSRGNGKGGVGEEAVCCKSQNAFQVHHMVLEVILSSSTCPQGLKSLQYSLRYVLVYTLM